MVRLGATLRLNVLAPSTTELCEACVIARLDLSLHLVAKLTEQETLCTVQFDVEYDRPAA